MIVYVFILNLIFYFILPVLIFKFLQNPQEWKERLGLQKTPNLTNKYNIWLHAASVGEINAIKPIIKRLANKYNKRNIIVTTMTKTGYNIAGKLTSKYPNVYNYFLPLDFSFSVKNFIKKIKPKFVIITETELWPLLIFYTKKYGCELVLINGRMTKESFQKYKFLKFIFRKVISHFDMISVQTKRDKSRFEYFFDGSVEVGGNIKFAIEIEPIKNNLDLKKKWGLNKDIIITLGSSRPEEEQLAVDLHKYLKENNVDHQMVLAPRHLDRLNEVKELIKDNGVNFCQLSKINSEFDLLLIDEMGVLVDVYSISDIALIGGSFYNYGGHNPLEAAYFGIPVIMGKFYSNCKETVELLKANNGIALCQKRDLPKLILKLVKNKKIRDEMGNSAKLTLKNNKDSLEYYLRVISKAMK